MVSPSATRSSFEQLEPGQEDWPAQVADTIVNVVGSVRDKTTGPALTIARGVVYGTFAAIVGCVALVLLVIASVRLIDSYLPDAVFGETHTWAAHMIIGLVLVTAGLVLWIRRHPRTEQTGPY
jgi:hypothetical protein